MKNAEYKTLQSSVSLPRIQEYYEAMIKGDVFPAIKVDLGRKVVVDGNHRYIASKLAGIDLDIRPYTSSISQKILDWDIIDIVSDVWKN